LGKANNRFTLEMMSVQDPRAARNRPLGLDFTPLDSEAQRPIGDTQASCSLREIHPTLRLSPLDAVARNIVVVSE